MSGTEPDLGVWTAEEVDSINRRAAEEFLRLSVLFDEPPPMDQVDKAIGNLKYNVAREAWRKAQNEIIGELVCCHIYEEAGEHPEGRLDYMRTNRAHYQNHNLCYWGGAAVGILQALIDGERS